MYNNTAASQRTLQAREIQNSINTTRAASFRHHLPGQAEHCARKILENVQHDLLSNQDLTSQEIWNLVQSADVLLSIRDRYSQDADTRPTAAA